MLYKVVDIDDVERVDDVSITPDRMTGFEEIDRVGRLRYKRWVDMGPAAFGWLTLDQAVEAADAVDRRGIVAVDVQGTVITAPQTAIMDIERRETTGERAAAQFVDTVSVWDGTKSTDRRAWFRPQDAVVRKVLDAEGRPYLSERTEA